MSGHRWKKKMVYEPAVPYGPPVPENVPPRWKVNKKEVALTAAKIAAPFVIGAIFKALSKK